MKINDIRGLIEIIKKFQDKTDSSTARFKDNKSIEDILKNDSFFTILQKIKNSGYQELNNEEARKSIINMLEILKISKSSTSKFSSNQKGKIQQTKNLLLKGVPGTGKSRLIDKIIENSKTPKENILKINIHSASSNADLMQGIAVSTSGENVVYSEKSGLILDHIRKAAYKPNEPFFIVLEEIQENSLNELIGDAIYLIEDGKRAEYEGGIENNEVLSYEDLIEKGYKNSQYVQIPNLVEANKTQKLIIPKNVHFYCTSNYRDDKKVIEDNLLRRFDVIEMYPIYYIDSKGKKVEYIEKAYPAAKFLKELNNSIENVLKDETHPDRFLQGHANWIHVGNLESKEFKQALLKTIIDFKDIKELELSIVHEILDIDFFDEINITENITVKDLSKKTYREIIEILQKDLLNSLVIEQTTLL